MKIAQYISRFFVSHGVTDCFMVTGGGAMHLNDAFGHDPGLHCVFNHNEQGSAIAAESYARLTGRIALLNVTSGPGGTNAITGVMGGWLDSIPMFVVSGQVKRETTLRAVPDLKLRQLGDQEYNIIDSVMPMTKYAVMVTEPEEIAYHLEKAWYLAGNGRKGPVWLDIPLDIQGAPVPPEESLRHFDPAAEGLQQEDRNDYQKLAGELAEKIRAAKAPLVFAGSGVRSSDSADLLLGFAEKFGIPVAVAWNSGDLVPFDHPYYAGSPSREGTRASGFIVQNCDLLLVLGSRMNIRTITYNKNDFGKRAYKIMVDIDENELRKPTFIPDFPVCGDVHRLLEAMLSMPYVPVPAHENFRRWCRKMIEKYPAVLPEYHHGEGLINPYVLIDRISAQMDEQDVLTLGNGSACVMTFTGIRIKKGQRMYTNSGCAAMGYGLPAALGAAVAIRGRDHNRVLCIDGDGSVMMNVQELATVAYNRLNVKLFILDNHGYHSIRQTQTNLFQGQFVGIDPESGVGFPDFELLSKAFSFRYYEIRTENEADGIIREALSAEGPVLIRAVVDPAQNFVPKLSSKVLPDGRIVSPSMDDMFPFLPRDEYESCRYNPDEAVL